MAATTTFTEFDVSFRAQTRPSPIVASPPVTPSTKSSPDLSTRARVGIWLILLICSWALFVGFAFVVLRFLSLLSTIVGSHSAG